MASLSESKPIAKRESSITVEEAKRIFAEHGIGQTALSPNSDIMDSREAIAPDGLPPTPDIVEK